MSYIYAAGFTLILVGIFGLFTFAGLFTLAWIGWRWIDDKEARGNPIFRFTRRFVPEPFKEHEGSFWVLMSLVSLIAAFFWPLFPFIAMGAIILFILRFMRRAQKAVGALSRVAHTHTSTEYEPEVIPAARARGGREQ